MLGRTACRSFQTVSLFICVENFSGFLILFIISTHFEIHGIASFSMTGQSTAPPATHIPTSGSVGSLPLSAPAYTAVPSHP